MAKAYYSIVLRHSADDVWAVIRPFDHYAWAGVPSTVAMEDGRSGDQVSSVRRVQTQTTILRQRLVAHSDIDRSYTYCFAEPPPFPADNYLATIRVMPVIQSGDAFVEWSATFDCSNEDRSQMIDQVENRGFAVWLGALRDFMSRS